MQSSNIPTKIPLPFANAASGTYRNTIPVDSQIGVVNGRASLADGFPPLNFTPINSGGVPPFGGDMNGILYEITAIQQWQQAGGFFPYDSSFATTIGGYPKGAILQSANTAGLWVSTAENNSTNPDTGGAGWTSLAFEGSQSVTVTSANVTLTQLQSAYPVIVVTGTLTGNRSLIFPNIVGEWIVQNNTSGAYTLTAKTAAGTGVTLTQGQSTYIYGDGTNIYFADSAKVASFNGRVGAVTLTALDVTNALGYNPYNATNPAGYTPLANFPYNFSDIGYQKLPTGMIMQWGYSYNAGYQTYVSPSIAYPTTLLSLACSTYTSDTTNPGNSYTIAFVTYGSGSFYWNAVNIGGNIQSNPGTVLMRWISVGY